MSKPYSAIAPIYNHLMRSVNYGNWANYLFSIYELVGAPEGHCLEVSAGTGNLSKYLLNKFESLIITDLSKEMLSWNRQLTTPKVVCNMLELPFKQKFGFVYSCFDSVNYLLTKNELETFFNSVSNILCDNGIFTFDVSLENNSSRYQKSLNRKGTVDNIKYEQKSYYSEKERIHYNNFIIFIGDKIFKEIHKQKIYKFFDYFEILENTTLYVENCFDSFSFDDAKKDSERVQFILKKRTNYDNI